MDLEHEISEVHHKAQVEASYTPEHLPTSFLGVPPEIRLHHIYPYILYSTQVHIRYYPASVKHDGSRIDSKVTWNPCQSSVQYPGLCANPPWPESCNAAPKADTLAQLLLICKTIATEIKDNPHILFKEAVVCINMQDIVHLKLQQNLNLFSRVTQVSIFGLIPCTEIGFAPNSDDSFNPLMIRKIFPHLRKASFHIFNNEDERGLSNRIVAVATRAAAWMPEVSVVKLLLVSGGGELLELGTMTKSKETYSGVNGVARMKHEVALIRLTQRQRYVHYSNIFFSFQEGDGLSFMWT